MFKDPQFWLLIAFIVSVIVAIYVSLPVDDPEVIEQYNKKLGE